MGWRELVEEALSGGDISDNSDNSGRDGAFVPSVPCVSPPRKMLRDWSRTVSALDPRRPAPGYDAARWHELVGCSQWWLSIYGRQAALDGWQTGDVFGVHPGKPRAGGLIDRLGTARNLMLEGKRARWRTFGNSMMRFNAGAFPLLPPYWEVG